MVAPFVRVLLLYPEVRKSLTVVGGPHGGTPFGADPEEEPFVHVHCPRLWKMELPNDFWYSTPQINVDGRHSFVH